VSEAQPITTTSPLAVAIAALVADGARRLVENEAGIRADSDIEHVHHARVGARRLRSNLSTFKRLVDDDWRQTIRAELAWIGSLLGEVRDADVLSVWLDAQAPTSTRRTAPVSWHCSSRWPMSAGSPWVRCSRVSTVPATQP